MGLWRRRWVRWLAIGVVVLLVALRIALPEIVRRVAVAQANQAIAGRLDIGDVDLWLLRGAIALERVAVRGEIGPPVAKLHRLYVNLAWRPLLSRIVQVEELDIDGPALYPVRERDGSVPLPGLREAPAAGEAAPAAGAAPAAEAAPAETGTPWSVVIDLATLRQGRVRLRDRVAEPPQDAELDLGTFVLRNFALQAGPDGKPGSGEILATFGDGSLRIKASVQRRPKGFTTTAWIDARNLPLDRTQTHVPQLGWSSFQGRLDLQLAMRLGAGELPVVRGATTLRDLVVSVQDEPDPVLAWRSLRIELESVDPNARRAVVSRVALDGAGVLARPRDPVALPLLRGLLGSPAVKPAPEPGTTTAPAPEAKPWAWQVHTVEVTDSGVRLVLDPPPLAIVIPHATVTGLSSEPGSVVKVDLRVTESNAALGVVGSVRLDPPAPDVQVTLAGVELGHLLAAVGGAPVQLPTSRLDADLHVATAETAATVKGTVTLGDVTVLPLQGGDEFRAAWERLAVAIDGLRVPGALGGPSPATEPITVDLASVELVAPKVVLTRTETGIVLPAAGATPAPAGEEGAPAAAPTPAPAAEAASPAAAAAPAPQVKIAGLSLTKGEVSVTDRTTRPFYRGAITDLGVQARDVALPAGTFAEFEVRAKAPGGAPIQVTGKRQGSRVAYQVSTQKLGLAQFNPYVIPRAGYSIAPRGTFTFDSRVTWGADAFESTNQLTLDQFDLKGAQGDSLFLQQFGVPLTLALALMRDVNGRIALGVPVAGDQRGTRVDLGVVVGQALARAIVNALASPLKLLGAVTMQGDRIASFQPEPVAFPPGRATPAPEATEKVEQLAGLVGSAPGVTLTLHGRAGGADDVRALQEAALLASLRNEGGVMGTFRNLATLGDRKAIRQALEEKARGGTPALEPGAQARLDEWAQEQEVSDGALTELAQQRAEALRRLLAEQHGVAADRITMGAVQVERADGTPSVAMEVSS
ncbi:MAG: DUF748 domain-containing protein [bacterium]|nr:DUF748 domain-containing protein [bacterium]